MTPSFSQRTQSWLQHYKTPETLVMVLCLYLLILWEKRRIHLIEWKKLFFISELWRSTPCVLSLGDLLSILYLKLIRSIVDKQQCLSFHRDNWVRQGRFKLLSYLWLIHCTLYKFNESALKSNKSALKNLLLNWTNLPL